MLVHLPREEGYGLVVPVKNGPALGGYGAVSMKNALATTMSTMPAQLRRSLTWDRGKELSAHAAFTIESGIPVCFADPRSPWQRGTNENTNGLLRQHFPKGTDLSRWNAEDLAAIASALSGFQRTSQRVVDKGCAWWAQHRAVEHPAARPSRQRSGADVVLAVDVAGRPRPARPAPTTPTRVAGRARSAHHLPSLRHGSGLTRARDSADRSSRPQAGALAQWGIPSTAAAERLPSGPHPHEPEGRQP